MVVWFHSGVDGVFNLLVAMVKQNVCTSTSIHHDPPDPPVGDSSKDHQGVIIRDLDPLQVVFIKGDGFGQPRSLGLDIHHMGPA